MAQKARKLSTVALNWKEVWYTNCPLVSASNVEEALGWTREEFKKIGLSKSLNTLKCDWWRITEEQGIELMLRLNGMTRKDVEIVEFPYPDDWYRDSKMLVPRDNPTELWLMRDKTTVSAGLPINSKQKEGVCL